MEPSLASASQELGSQCALMILGSLIMEITVPHSTLLLKTKTVDLKLS